MENKKMSQVVVCDNCGERFLITADNIVSEKEFKDKDGNKLYLTYFDCPHCKQTFYVQVDNQMSLELKKKCLDLFRKLARCRIAKREVPSKQRDKFNNVRSSLGKERTELMKRYNEYYVTDTETGEERKIKFTIV